MLITNVANIPANAELLGFANSKQEEDKRLAVLAKGKVQNIKNIEAICNSYGKSIGEMMVQPNSDASKWENSSSGYFKDTFLKYLQASRIKYRHIGKFAGVAPSSLTKYTQGDYMPTTTSAQALADCMQIEVADFFVPAKPENVEKIETVTFELAKTLKQRCLREQEIVFDDPNIQDTLTNKAWMVPNFERMIRAHNVTSPDKDLRRLLDTGKAPLKVIDMYARWFGSTIGDVMVKPGVKTEWYKESSNIYVPYNLEQMMNDSCLPVAQIAQKAALTNLDVVYQFVKGVRIPTLAQLQELAYLFDCELSDFFLPPDGGGDVNKTNEK